MISEMVNLHNNKTMSFQQGAEWVYIIIFL